MYLAPCPSGDAGPYAILGARNSRCKHLLPLLAWAGLRSRPFLMIGRKILIANVTSMVADRELVGATGTIIDVLVVEGITVFMLQLDDVKLTPDETGRAWAYENEVLFLVPNYDILPV